MCARLFVRKRANQISYKKKDNTFSFYLSLNISSFIFCINQAATDNNKMIMKRLLYKQIDYTNSVTVNNCTGLRRWYKNNVGILKMKGC